MKLSDYLVQEIFNITGTDKIFGYIGGMIAHIVDSIYKNKNIEMINTITEQAAGFAAEGYARTYNKLGIAIATSGPGATNLVTTIANCYFDSTPVLFITGQVNTYEYKAYNIKQCGFQETNIVDIVKPITKYAKIINKAEDIQKELHKAINIALSGRKGPVLLDIPMNIQRAEIDINNLSNIENLKKEKNIDNKLNLEALIKAKRPLILAGNGINLANAQKELMKFLNKTQIPVVQTLLGISTVLGEYKYNMGFIGTYGERYGNLALYNCDYLLVLGSRLDIRQTGAKIDFMHQKHIVQVDIDNSELNCPKFNKEIINKDLQEFLKELNEQNIQINITEWKEYCTKLKEKFNYKEKHYSMPNSILFELFNKFEENTNIISDVGQNQMWAAQSAVIKPEQKMFSSGGLGCMGFALPAAIGASINGRKTYVITGDGGLQMNLQELEILKRRNLPVKIIVLNNKNLGMVRTFQELYFDKRYASTVYDYSAPDFHKIANAYGLDSVTISSGDFRLEDIEEILESTSPVLINITFEQNTQVEPRLEFGNSIENASPIVDLTEFRINSKLEIKDTTGLNIAHKGGVKHSHSLHFNHFNSLNNQRYAA